MNTQICAEIEEKDANYCHGDPREGMVCPMSVNRVIFKLYVEQ